MNIYALPSGPALQYTASVQLPTTGKVVYNPASFSVAPVITHGAGFDTATWTNPAANTITWTSTVTGIQPADVLPAALGGTVNFTVSAGSGTIPLRRSISTRPDSGTSPATQTFAPGQLATYSLTVYNPTASPVSYNLAVTGVPQSWVSARERDGSREWLVGPHFVPALGAGRHRRDLQLHSHRNGGGGASGSVQGYLVCQGSGSIGSVASMTVLGASVALSPASGTAGQGGSAAYTVQVTNAGNTADTYNLTAVVPAGVTSQSLIRRACRFRQGSLTSARRRCISAWLTVRPRPCRRSR